MHQLQDNDDGENTETSYDDWNNYIEDLQFANPKVEFILHNTTPIHFRLTKRLWKHL